MIIRYLKLMHKTERDLVYLASRNFHHSTRYCEMPNAVTITWFNYRFMAYLKPKAIPQSILPALNSEGEIEFANGTLCGYGFLTRRETEDMFDMHSLVQ
ncbi:hypothetical protein N7447_008219 [Penicillium robsamsonii]|uniref:uncharacterized protein n=1 Tax=Penicillium robsamsonii TaxID=1792511 RepID=UPI00254902AD|nr:uncharacterized protein N7447_008219 [Penicillium robsamsonii]KAJ5815986.1 hypothetical protein N7447_008219 [Penicillium robsamsonii]